MIIGECGLCGGNVFVPDQWYGTIPPTPFCDRCGAKPIGIHRPIIPMNRDTQMYRVLTNNRTTLEHV